MAEGITENGLSLLSYNELLAQVQQELNNIYASDGNAINFDSNTPDGQFTNILTQIGTDVRELATEVYNSFNPDSCSGSVQDMRYAINFIKRKQGTFTIQNIDVTVTQTVTLTGLDGNYDNPAAAGGFVVSDGSSDLWYLIDSVTLTAGTHSLAFRSKNYGLYSPAINTLKTMVTIIPGVVSVTNSVSPTTYGEEQETDLEFRLRRERSTFNKGQNNIDGLQSALLDVDTLTDCTVWVNNTTGTDETGTPAGQVWVIVEGGANDDIGALIYQYSCGMQTRGDILVNMLSVSGQVFPTHFDRANPVPLYIKFEYFATGSISQDYITGLKNYIAENLKYKLKENAETSKVTSIAIDAINSNGGTGYPLNVQVSLDGTTWEDYIALSSLQDKFVVDSSRITITSPSS